jgi:Trypsin-like peptidase domain/FHA domain
MVKWRLIWGMGLVLAFISAPGSQVAAAPDAELWERSIVRVVSVMPAGTGTGTGWIINDQGYIATNQHVIGGAAEIYIIRAGETLDEAVEARVIWSNENYDLAVLQVAGLGGTPFVLATNDPARGSAAYAAGFPGVADVAAGNFNNQVSVTSGTVSLVVTHGQTGQRIIQHDTRVAHGNSGGPLIDDCDRVMGITSAYLSGNDSDVVFLSIHITELTRQLDSLGVDYVAESSICQPGGTDLAGGGALSNDLDELNRRFMSWGALLAGLVLIALVVALRKPRERIARAVEGLSKRVRGTMEAGAPPEQTPCAGIDDSPIEDQPPTRTEVIPPRPQAAPTRTMGGEGFVLSGFGGDGNTLRIEFSSANMVDAGKGISLGRSTSLVDFTIDEAEISRRHARVSMEGQRLFIEDLNSTNGTFVNGKQLGPFGKEPIRLHDVIRLGRLEFKLSKMSG